MVSESATLGIVLNGERSEVPRETTLEQLVQSLGKDPRTVAIERNGQIVRRASFGAQEVEAGDVLEIVQFVQGG